MAAAGAGVSEARVRELIGEVQTAMSKSLRDEFTATLQEVDTRIGAVQKAMSEDIRKEFEATRQTVLERLEAVTGMIETTVSSKFDQADEAFKAERDAMHAVVRELKEAWEMADNEIVRELSQSLADKAEEDRVRIQTVATAFGGQITELRNEQIGWRQHVDQAISSHDNVLNAHRSDGGGGEGQAPQGTSRPPRGLDVRVPDPRQWVLDVLKDGNKEWYEWRKTFELQVRSVWGNMSLVLEGLRELKVPMTTEDYAKFLEEFHVVPEGGNRHDYGHQLVSQKLYMDLHLYCGPDAQKVIEESFEQCGFEAYRLLNAAYDPLSVDAEHQLVERVLQIGNWSVKGLSQIESMMREAKTRIRALKKKTPSPGEQIEAGMMRVFMSMLFAKLDFDTKKYCQEKGGRESFEQLETCIKTLKALDKSMNSNKMDIGSVAEVEYSHAEFVEWQDAGCPDEWDYGYEEPPTNGQYPSEEDPSQLAAFNSKGKGK